MFITKKTLRKQIIEAELEIENLRNKLSELENRKKEAEQVGILAEKRADTNQKENLSFREKIIALMFALEKPEIERNIDYLGCIPFDKKRPNGPCTLYTGFCQMGGCYIGGVKLNSKTDAYIYASLFIMLNGGPSSGLCSECRSDYMEMIGA